MTEVWGVLLIGLGGLLAGGTISIWRTNRTLAIILAACAAVAVLAGVLRLDY